MRYGIIGTGWIAESFIEGVRLVTGGEISAVYSRSIDKGADFAARNNIGEIYTDLESFANGNFDAVYVASPNAMHFIQSEKMLLAGKHVICEKPVTVTNEEYRHLKYIADKNGLIFLEAIMYLHQPVVHKIREYTKKIGKIRSAHFDFSQLSSKYPAYLRGETPNIFNPALATGGLMDLGIYCIYPALDLFGMPKNVSGSAVFLTTGADAAGSILFEYNDFLLTVTYSKTGQDYLGSQIIGESGTIIMPSISKLTDVSVRFNIDGREEHLTGDIQKAVLMGNEAKDFEKYTSGLDRNEYENCCRLADEATVLTEKMRSVLGICFK
ncbi:MAG: Gfo/Idh/MocA family oxidoreductase [Clostridiales bacterium]|nr:Gfo/Idh/MocA family oxidoreductase [Clostridiales bacterium]